MENREPIEVLALCCADGSIVPGTIIINGTKYPVKLLRVTPLETIKQGGSGTRYEVAVGETRDVLYLEAAASYTARRLWYRVNN